MNTLLRLLQQYKHVLLFLLLEAAALVGYFNYSYEQKVWAGFFLHRQGAVISRWLSSWRNYLSLEPTNQRLAQENVDLRNQLARYELAAGGARPWRPSDDSTRRLHYLTATVVSNSVARQRNYFMLDAGQAQGLEPQMPVLSQGAVAGFTVAISPHYAMVISLLNTDLRISAKLQRSNYFGSLHWDGLRYREVLLTEIPHHVFVAPGDTVMTSGYSNIFPAALPIGIVKSIENQGGDFNTYRVELAVDFRKLHHVTLIKNPTRAERDSLQQTLVEHVL